MGGSIVAPFPPEGRDKTWQPSAPNMSLLGNRVRRTVSRLGERSPPSLPVLSPSPFRPSSPRITAPGVGKRPSMTPTGVEWSGGEWSGGEWSGVPLLSFAFAAAFNFYLIQNCCPAMNCFISSLSFMCTFSVTGTCHVFVHMNQQGGRTGQERKAEGGRRKAEGGRMGTAITSTIKKLPTIGRGIHTCICFFFETNMDLGATYGCVTVRDVDDICSAQHNSTTGFLLVGCTKRRKTKTALEIPAVGQMVGVSSENDRTASTILPRFALCRTLIP